MSQRYFIELSFRGDNYHGWQLQPNALTVQACVNSALEILLQKPVETTGAGRTDTGVHAHYFVAHFNTDNPVVLEAPESFVYKLNCILPRDIAVNKIYPVNAEVHARYTALSRTYEYSICTYKNPFTTEYAWFLPQNPDLQLMNNAAERLKDFHDFTSFSKLHGNAKTNICRIFLSYWDTRDNMLVYTIKADRFLRNMVRAIVGTLVEVGLSRISMKEFIEIAEARDRRRAGYSVPAHGLTLKNIEYPDNIYT